MPELLHRSRIRCILIGKCSSHAYPAGTLGYLDGSGEFIPLDVEFRYRDRSSNPPPVETPLTGQDASEARDELQALLPYIDARTVLVLDAALRSENFEELGKVLGHGGEYARKAAKVALARACKVFAAAETELAKKIAA